MARGAGVDLHFLFRGTRLYDIAARARDRRVFVVGMDSVFHLSSMPFKNVRVSYHFAVHCASPSTPLAQSDSQLHGPYFATSRLADCDVEPFPILQRNLAAVSLALEIGIGNIITLATLISLPGNLVQLIRSF